MKIKSALLVCILLILAGCRSDETEEETPTAVQEELTPAAIEENNETTVETAEPEPVEPAQEEETAASTEPSLADLGPGWTAVEPGGETRCAHNTPYTYWVRPGTTNKLLIYFEGGGGCWDAETCAAGSTFYDDDVSPDDDPNGRTGGILDSDNPDNPFSDYNMVFIPSCTGDVHWGSNVQTYPKADGGELTIYHHGFINASSALDWAYANIASPNSIFVTGCSAGSVGSIAHAPYIIEQYPGIPVTQLGDSLAFVFHRPVNVHTDYHAHDNFPDWIPALEAITPGELLMSDFYNAVANYYPDYTFSQYNTEADNVQVRFYGAVGGDTDDFPADLAANLTRIHEGSSNFRSYTASGNLHCIMPRPQFYTTEVNGVRLRDWVNDLANGEVVSSVRCETCENETELTADLAVNGETAELLTHSWQEVGIMPTVRSENRGGLIDGLIYVPGGWGGESVLEAYNPQTGEWQSLAELPDGRHHFMTTAYDGKLYLFGGSPVNAYRPSNNAWVYDPAADSWSELSPLPEARMGGAAVTLGDAIYLVGGESPTGAQPNYRYDPAADSWSQIAAMNQFREHTAAVAWESKIYVFGGWWRGSGELTSMEIYDPETDSWIEGPDMSVARGGLAAEVHEGRIFVIGGEILTGSRHTEDVVEVFDPATETWATATPLPFSIHGFPLISYDGALWIIGGSNRAGGEENDGIVLRYG